MIDHIIGNMDTIQKKKVDQQAVQH